MIALDFSSVTICIENIDFKGKEYYLYSRSPLNKDEILKCRLQLPKKVLRVELLSLTAECKWCRPIGSKSRYESGHKFVDVSKEDSAVLLHLMINYGKPRHGEKRIIVVG